MVKEVDIETGRRHTFVLTRNLVELRIEWPEHLVDRLPDDFTLSLWGPQLPRQERKKSAASRDGDLFQFEFEWEDKTKGVQLEASGNGRTVVLWREQVAGNLDTEIDWDERLHPLLSEHQEVEVAGQPAGAGSVPEDLRGGAPRTHHKARLMDHTFPVTVVDDKGASVAGARVCLVKKTALKADEHHPFPSAAATHNDSGGGKYNESAKITPSEEDWTLVVTLTGKAPVVQPLKFKARGEEFTAAPRPSAVATVTITGTVRKVGAPKVKEINFHVILHPAAEIVFIAGVDYNRVDIGGGWLFHEYGFNRAEILRREKKIHSGTIVTVFSTAKIWRTTRVWGVGKWVDIEVAPLGDRTTRVLGATPDSYQPVAGLDIHMTDFYKYLAEVGAREPKSVKEIGIFSHSHPGGPILYNTGERAVFAPDTSLRDPADFDARVKDFNGLNFPSYAKMVDALAPDCRFTIWGCSATTHFKFRSREALKAINKGLAEDVFFTVRSEAKSHDAAIGVYLTDEEHTSEIRHRFEMDARFRGFTYAAEAAKKLNIEVRAACPGTGSDPTKVDGIEMLMVNLNTYKDVFDYFHKKFAPEFVETKGKWDQGYVDYNKIQSRPAVALPTFSTEYYYLRIRKKATRWQVPGADLTFWNDKSVNHPTPNVQVVTRPVVDLVSAGKKGHLIILKDQDDTKSQAVFVQEDEKIFKITRNAMHEWKVIGPEI